MMGLIGWFAIAVSVMPAWQAPPSEPPLPDHPSNIVFPPLEYKLPSAGDFRATLSNGIVVYIAEDRELPVFDIRAWIRVGGAFDPPGKSGLAQLMGEQLRDGGTRDLSPSALDEKIEFLAANLTTSAQDTRTRAVLSCLSKDVDEALALFVQILRHPRFDQDRLRRARERLLQEMRRRNDSTQTIEDIEWCFRVFGPDYAARLYPTSATVSAVTREDLASFHRRYVQPANITLAVAGDFSRDEMLARLERVFGGWNPGDPAPRSFPAPDYQPTPGVYVVNKPDVNQGRVSIGHRSVVRGTQGELPLRVMNGLLGGAGFQSRLFRVVRSKEGLAYRIGSAFEQGAYYPEDFRCYFQSRSDACAYATGLVIEQIERLRNEAPSSDEIDRIISYFVESFPQAFGSKIALMSAYAEDEYTGRNPAYWQTWVERMKAVTPEDVHRVAREHLHPDRMVIVAVGDAERIEGGGYAESPETKVSDFGPVTIMPPRNPETLRPAGPGPAAEKEEP